MVYLDAGRVSLKSVDTIDGDLTDKGPAIVFRDSSGEDSVQLSELHGLALVTFAPDLMATDMCFVFDWDGSSALYVLGDEVPGFGKLLKLVGKWCEGRNVALRGDVDELESCTLYSMAAAGVTPFFELARIRSTSLSRFLETDRVRFCRIVEP